MRVVWLVLGLVALGLAVVGVVLPVLPTTPLVILAAFAFARSSPRLAHWLDSHGVFGPIIADWRENGAIAPQYKVIALAMMGATLALSAAMSVAPLVIAVQVVCIAAAAGFILTRPNSGPTTR